ncbi:hypothetical protein BURC_00642 [Burkholderiaceae bacterium]|nr:hypothetical protein BURC_00642 [Burkholderiaceae bacterium]
MKPFKTRIGELAGAVALMLGAASAQASLVLVEPQDFGGTGLGAVNTILTISSPASSSFESGSVAFGNVTSGDVMTGSSQTQTRTLGELGVESASSLRVVFNALEPGNADAQGITLADLVLNIYSPSGDVLFTSGAFTPVNFADTFTGAGNSGFVFALDAAQQAAAAAAFGASFQDNVVGLSAAAGCNAGSPAGCLGATGGFETFFVANAGPVAAIPEPETYALMLAGLGMVAFMLLRSRGR